MEYNICKDEKPEETIKKIKNLLKEKGIHTQDYFVNFDTTKKYVPRSMSVYIKGNPQFGTNGKGSSYINCKASGYGEFMERLQNFMLINEGALLLPDERLFTSEELLNSTIAKYFTDKDFLLSINKFISDNCGKNIMVPFYSVKDRKEVFLPREIILFLQGSNGMAAGNTIEEALVQGLSEICERFVLKNIILNKIRTPEIPREEYMKYKKLKNLIEYIESLGLELILKDASLGQNLPVIIGLLKNNQNDSIFFNIGAHPSFPVAIERVITELFQGIEINNNTSVKDSFENIGHNITNNIQDNAQTVFLLMFLSLASFPRDSILGKIFLDNKSKYEFNKTAFVSKNNTDNKQILNFLLKNINHITNNEIYIRDVSFLGFPSVYIYIPSISDVLKTDKTNIKALTKIDNLKDKIAENDYNKTEKLLKAICQYVKTYKNFNNIIKNGIKPIYLILYSLLKDDKEMFSTYTYLFNLFDITFSEKQTLLIRIIEDYFKIKAENKDKNITANTLLKKYTKEEVTFFFKIYNNLSVKIITKDICNNDEMKNKSNEEELRIQKILQKEYRNNVPNQSCINSLFNSIAN